MADEKDNKFIIGDNSDGYRRSASADSIDFSLFEERPRKVREAQPAAPQKKKQAGKRIEKAPVAKKPRKKAQPVQKKPVERKPVQKRPTSAQQAPVAGRTSRPAKANAPARRPAQQRKPLPADERSLSQNERIRRHNEMRRIQRRRRQIISYAAIGLAVIAVMVALSLTVFFQISEISVKGISPYPDEQIIDSCGLALGENVIRCDADGVSQKLSESLPYISGATVKRTLSGKVVITVRQTTGKYALQYANQCVVLDATGKVLEIAAAEQAQNYTLVQNTEVGECVPGTPVALTDPGALEKVLGLGNALDSAGIAPITSLDISHSSEVKAVFEGRITLLIGTTDSLSRKLALAAHAIESENAIDPLQHGIVNLTVENKAFFRPEEVTAEESKPATDTDTTEPKKTEGE